MAVAALWPPLTGHQTQGIPSPAPRSGHRLQERGPLAAIYAAAAGGSAVTGGRCVQIGHRPGDAAAPRQRPEGRRSGPGQRPGVIGASPVNGPFDIKRLCLRGQVQQTRAQYWQEAQAAHQAARAVNHFTRSQERA